ncbi:ribosome-associated protein [Kushneria avicenniae]|uniref:Ribosome-associated protein n=1 Tax=Kushneria avicenniae TaxID=402385 RepID=A0A1I1KUI0_9GAMM|nr:alternative ribosome rescue aminoacyl-tRNA hydrolase ArfB [Kushneria avicenniae]SFC64439.1 ribosome-associated protein [Kushneria avicenniae]
MHISRHIAIDDSEFEMHAIRSQGSGGQNVNKVASAIHLRMDIQASSLAQEYKDRLLSLNDHRITASGMIIIKAQSQRTQELNRQEAQARLRALIKSVIHTDRPRKATRPTLGSKKRRLEGKKQRGQKKALRGRVDH